MAYITFYVDSVNGTDVNPANLTSCTVSNPSGTITRVNKTSHGLVTGQTVNLSAFSTWLNAWWTITVVDANNFDLNDAVWQTTAITTGTVSPRNGYSWATAYKNVYFISNASYNKTVDILVAKSPDPVSLGNATWTNLTGNITLATAQTLTIDNCEVTWTAANSATTGTYTSTGLKQGSFAAQIITPASTLTSTKYAYRTLPSTLDLSSYQKISFWFCNRSSAVADANRYTINLCSDTTGDTVVDSFSIPAVPTTTNFIPFTLARNGGGNLGSSIKSIAIYTGTSTPGNSQTINLDNIFATTTNGLCLNSVISKCNSATYDHNQDPWHPIDYIDGTTVELSTYQNSTWNQQRSYKYFTKGTSPQTVTTYFINPILLPQTSSSQKIIILPQTTATIQILGGYNTSTNTKDGMTWYDGRTTYGWFISGSGTSTATAGKNFIVSDFGALRFGQGILCSNGNGVMIDGTFSNLHILYNFGNNLLIDGTGERLIFNNVTFNNTSAVMQIGGGGHTMTNIKMYNMIPELYFDTPYSYLTNFDVCNYAVSVRILNNAGGIYKNWYCDVGTKGASSQRAIYISNGNEATFYNTTVANSYNAIGGDAGGVINFINGTLTGNTYSVGRGYNFVANVVNPISRTDTNYVQYSTGVSGVPYMYTFATFTGVAGDTNNNRIYGMTYNNTETIQVLSQTTTRHTASGIAWQINILSTLVTESIPYALKVATVAVNANSQVTVKAWLKLSNATNIGAKLAVYDGAITGITTDITATKSANTNWEELSISFTPTIKGSVDIYVLAYWKASTANQSVYVDDMTITQV